MENCDEDFDADPEGIKSHKDTMSYKWIKHIYDLCVQENAKKVHKSRSKIENLYFTQRLDFILFTLCRFPLWSNIMNEKFNSKNDVVTSSHIESQFKNEKRLLGRHSRVDKYVEDRLKHLRGQFKLAIGRYMAAPKPQHSNTTADDVRSTPNRSQSALDLSEDTIELTTRSRSVPDGRIVQKNSKKDSLDSFHDTSFGAEFLSGGEPDDKIDNSTLSFNYDNIEFDHITSDIAGNEYDTIENMDASLTESNSPDSKENPMENWRH